MNFISPTNQKEAPISWGDWLIVQAKESGEIRKILLKALLRPKSYSDPKTLENRRWITALRVASVAGTSLSQVTGDQAATRRWIKIWNLLLACVRTQWLSGPPVLKKDVRELKRTLERLRHCYGTAIEIDWEPIDKDLRFLELKMLESVPKSLPRRGRRLTEHQMRIIAAVELLHQCSVSYPYRIVVEELWEVGVNREEKTISNLWSRYKSYPRRHPQQREALPEYWLTAIYPFIFKQLPKTVTRPQAGIGT